MGPSPMQLVVVMAVRKAVRAATITFTATSMKLFFFITDNVYRLLDLVKVVTLRVSVVTAAVVTAFSGW